MTTHTSQTGPPSAQDRAAEVAGTAREQTGQIADTAKNQASYVAHDAVDQARNLLDELRTNVREQVGVQRDNLAQTLDQFASELRQMADRSDNGGPATEAVRQVAARMQTLRSTLERDDVATDIRRFARRRPGTFLLACAAAGVLAGRLTRGAAAGRARSGGPGQEVSEQEWRQTYPEVGYRTAPASEEPGYDGYGDREPAGYFATDTGVEQTGDPDLRPSDPLVGRESADGGQSSGGRSAHTMAGDPVTPDQDVERRDVESGDLDRAGIGHGDVGRVDTDPVEADPARVDPTTDDRTRRDQGMEAGGR